MVLRFEPDVARAGWVAESNDHWAQLCSMGPSHFPRYVRLFHPLPADTGPEDGNVLASLEGNLNPQALTRLLRVLARHTSTPTDCYFCLWEGFGEIHGSPAVALGYAHSNPGEERREPPPVPPAFPPEVMNGPRVTIPARNYLLFRGPLHEAGQWGAADLVPGQARAINSPNMMWPADHAWFVATEIDLPWTGIGGSEALVDALLADNSLDTEEITPSARPPYWRDHDANG